MSALGSEPAPDLIAIPVENEKTVKWIQGMFLAHFGQLPLTRQNQRVQVCLSTVGFLLTCSTSRTSPERAISRARSIADMDIEEDMKTLVRSRQVLCACEARRK
jgi:hypothetical protein